MSRRESSSGSRRASAGSRRESSSSIAAPAAADGGGAAAVPEGGRGDGLAERQHDNVKVSVRIRPLNRRETAGEEFIAWEWTERSLQLKERSQVSLVKQASSPSKQRRNDPPKAAFTYDYLFHPHADNDDVYRVMGKHVVMGAVEGFHSSIFAYGQTSTGKTHTMLGAGSRITGILGHAVDDVFEMIRASPDREYLLRVSFMEIYNEALNDLLVPTSTNLVIFEHSKKGCVVRGLLEEVVTSPERIFELVTSGLRHRKVGSTNYNAKSSRSHTIFRMIIESKPKGASSKRSAVRISTLSMIDLAGSESLKLSGAKGARKAEGGYINKSLLTLGKIIYKLSESKSDPNMHVPYRDSKLTRILQSSLKGNSKISIVCCVTPASGCVDETVNTLKFAARAKRIKHEAIINEVEDSHALLHRYKKEIEELKKQLSMYQQNQQLAATNAATAAGGAGGGPSPPRTSAELLVEEKDKEQLQRIIKQLTDMILDSEKLSGDQRLSATDAETTDTEGSGGNGSRRRQARATRPRRGSGSVVGGGLLGEDNLIEAPFSPSTPSPSADGGGGGAADGNKNGGGGGTTERRRRHSLATSKHEMRDIKAALEMLMERTAVSPTAAAAAAATPPALARAVGASGGGGGGGGGGSSSASSSRRHTPMPPPEGSREAALRAEVAQLKNELKEKDIVLQEAYGLIDTAVQNQEDLTKQHEEIMAENEKLRSEVADLRSIAEAAGAALGVVDENERLQRELERYKKICLSRERELLEIKGVSPEAESF